MSPSVFTFTNLSYFVFEWKELEVCVSLFTFTALRVCIKRTWKAPGHANSLGIDLYTGVRVPSLHVTNV